MFLLTFFIVFAVVVFVVSSTSKFRDMSQFQQVLERLPVPSSFHQSRAVPILVAGSEVMVVVLLLGGGDATLVGFLFAALLLLTFTGVLARTLFVGRIVSCSCFGPSTRPINRLDIVRNIGILACCISGFYLALTGSHAGGQLVEVLVTSAIACLFAVVWMGIGDIYDIFTR